MSFSKEALNAVNILKDELENGLITISIEDAWAMVGSEDVTTELSDAIDCAQHAAREDYQGVYVLIKVEGRASG